MMCEMCGVEVTRTKLVMVEGAAVHACQRCEKFASSPAVKTKDGVVLRPDVAERLDSREKRRKERDIYEKTDEKELVLDYHQRIRLGRQKTGMSHDDLAKLINEKKSVIIKVECGEMIPPDQLVFKLEKALNISLREVMEDAGELKKSEYSRGLTLGDFIKVKEKK